MRTLHRLEDDSIHSTPDPTAAYCNLLVLVLILV